MSATAPDYTIGFSKAEILAILEAQKAELTKVMAAWGEANGTVTKRRVDEIHTIIGACQRALRILYPDQYPTVAKRSRRVGQSVMSPSFR
jgi:hypothetical protein